MILRAVTASLTVSTATAVSVGDGFIQNSLLFLRALPGASALLIWITHDGLPAGNHDINDNCDCAAAAVKFNGIKFKNELSAKNGQK